MYKRIFMGISCLFILSMTNHAAAEEVESHASFDCSHSSSSSSSSSSSDSSSSHHHKRKKFVLFRADTNDCRFAIEDRNALDLGTADFVTAFGGDDFQCSVINLRTKGHSHSHHESNCCCPSGVLQILPANGTSFTKSLPPFPEPGPTIAGVFDHVKFLAYSIFAFAPIDGGELCSTWCGAGRQINVDAQPYTAINPTSVKDPHQDPRLAAFCFVSLDPALLLTSDWICTDDIIYALYERLPGAEGLFGYYAAFTYLIPVFHRKSSVDPLEDFHKFQTCYNREKGTITWILDGKKVFQVDKIGFRLSDENGFVFKDGHKKRINNPNRYLVNDHGGNDQLISPVGFQTGLSFFTLLDYYLPNNHKGTPNEGLVRLESSQFRTGDSQTGFFYNNPLVPGQQGTFVYDSPLDGSGLFHTSTIPATARLWGQGAELRLASYEVAIQE